MILSKYCKIYPDTNDPAKVVLFSTKRASKIVIPESMLKDIGKNNLSNNERETLTDLGFLVTSEHEEKAEMLCFMDELNAADRVFSVQLVMNLDCNLNCRYCFEGGRKGRFYMTDETVRTFAEFMDKTVGTGIEKIKIAFYGGEPLLSEEMILSLSDTMRSFAGEKRIEYSAKLITNGTLLTPRSVRRLICSGISAVSITLDGPQSIHDSARPFRNGRGSYRTIINNLREISGMVDIDIGGNFTKENYQRFPELLDQLPAWGLGPEEVSSLQFYPVIREVEGIANPDFNDGYTSINEPWIFESEIFLREEVLKRGYRSARIIPSTCMMDIKNRVIVNYDGAIYKCSGLIGREEYKVGDIEAGIRDYSASHNLNTWKNEECLQCEYLPLCFGGCRYLRLLREGNMKGVDCKKPYLDATLERAVKQDIRYGLAE